MVEKTCMNCGRSSCDYKDAMRCSNGNALWGPDTKALRKCDYTPARSTLLVAIASVKEE